MQQIYRITPMVQFGCSLVNFLHVFKKSFFRSNSGGLLPQLIFIFKYPLNIYLFKFNNRNTGKRCEICSRLALKLPERGGVFIVNFEHISHFFLSFLLLTPNKQMFARYVLDVSVDYSQNVSLAHLLFFILPVSTNTFYVPMKIRLFLLPQRKVLGCERYIK